MGKPVDMNCNNAICDDESGIANLSGFNFKNDSPLLIYDTDSGSSKCEYNIFSDKDSGRFSFLRIMDKLFSNLLYGIDTSGSKFDIGAERDDDRAFGF